MFMQHLILPEKKPRFEMLTKQQLVDYKCHNFEGPM